MNDKYITGVLQAQEKNILFSSIRESFEFCFMSDYIYSHANNNIPLRLPVINGFLCGKTHEGYGIAIYIGNRPFGILTHGTLLTSAYIITKDPYKDISTYKFEAIKFVGKTLNNVFDIHALDIDYEENGLNVQCNDDKITYTVETLEYNIEIDIYSKVTVHNGIDGNSINNKDVILTLKFDNPQSMDKVFHHYNRIKELLSFMTFRNNVGFDRIFLLNTHQEINHLIEEAELFIRYDYEMTSKEYYQNITFNDLGAALPSLLKLFYDPKDIANEKQTISLGFIPENDRNITTMTNTKIRMVCSSLECEIHHTKDIKVEENEILAELTQKVKDYVKGIRKDHQLTNDTYNLIFSDIKNWSLPLAEKLCALYHKYEEEMLMLNNSTVNIDDNLLKAFVKYRNNITHGTHQTLDTNTAITAAILCGLVYCCILERIGLSRDKIKELCDNSKIIT